MSTNSKSSVSTVSTTANAVQGSTAISTGNIGKNSTLNLRLGISDSAAIEAANKITDSIQALGANSFAANNPSQNSFVPLVMGGTSQSSPVDNVPEKLPLVSPNNPYLLLLGGGAALIAIYTFASQK